MVKPGASAPCLGRRSVARFQRIPQGSDVRSPEHDAISGGDVDELEVDPSASDFARQIGQYAWPVINLDHDHLLFAGDCEMRDPQEVLCSLGVGHKNVELCPFA